MRADLHVHTIASDGIYSPEKIIFIAKTLSLGAIAITDHDTTEGVEPATRVGKICRVEVVPGIELGAEYDGEELHILGYQMELDDQVFLGKLELLREARLGRMSKMIKKLQEMGLPVNEERVLAIAGPGSVGRPHLAAALVEAGAVKNVTEAFEKYIGKGRPAYMPRFKLSPVEAVLMVRDAGGSPVLAHPGLNNPGRILGELIGAGLVGIEAYHPGHSREQASYYHRLAKEHDLVVTGGSDYHGPGHKAGCRLGSDTVPYRVVDELRNRRCKG